jgi:hypothetical protein
LVPNQPDQPTPVSRAGVKRYVIVVAVDIEEALRRIGAWLNGQKGDA